MPRFAANLSMMFNEVPFLDRFAAAASAGFKAVEVLFPYEQPAAEIRARLEANGLTQALFNLPPGNAEQGERGLAALAGREADFARALDLALRYAEATGCRRLHAMAGLHQHGAERATFIANLRKATEIAGRHGVEILIEPINARDVPGYFLNRLEDARDIIAEVGSPHLGLQLDVYHRQIVAGDLTAALREFMPLTRHMQIANPPDRGEPDDGEINYSSIFRLIDDLGYTGFVGCEYRPRNGTREGLVWAQKLGVKLG